MHWTFTPTNLMSMIAAWYPLTGEHPQALRSISEEIFADYRARSESPGQVGLSVLQDYAQKKIEKHGLESLMAPSPYSPTRQRIETELKERFPFLKVPDLQEAALHVFEAWDRDQRPMKADESRGSVPASYVDIGMRCFLQELEDYQDPCFQEYRSAYHAGPASS